jgi:hypothetical protein
MCTRAWKSAGTAGPNPTAKGEHAMKKDEVTIGGTYGTKVGNKTVDVRIDSENAKGGWNAVAVGTGKPVRVKDARQLRAAATDGDRTVEPVDEGAAAGDAGDGDLVPLTMLDKEKKRAGKKAKGAKAPKEKPARPAKAPKEKKPKAMSCLDAAAAVLKAKGEPMRCKEMVAEMKEKGLWTTDAPTPEATLYSAILREITAKKGEARFKKTDRGHFALKD